MGCDKRIAEEPFERDSGSDGGPHPRSRRASDCLGLELEKLGYFAPNVPECDKQGRAAENRQRNHSGRSNAEPKPHRHGDLIGIYGGG